MIFPTFLVITTNAVFYITKGECRIYVNCRDASFADDTTMFLAHSDINTHALFHVLSRFCCLRYYTTWRHDEKQKI